MQSSAYLLSLPAYAGANPNSILALALPGPAAVSLKAIAKVDAYALWYSGAISLAQAANGIHYRRYAWATVKLYYATYYFLRARLLLDGWCQFYVMSKPRAVLAAPGAMAKKLKGTSHESCFNLFADVFPTSPLITQDIGVDSASAWLKSRRESINYIVARFPDPDNPEWFDACVTNGVRQMVGSYFEDPWHYAFLPDHAMLAYPIAAALDLVGAIRLDPEVVAMPGDKVSLRQYWRDATGPLPTVERIVP